MVAYASTQTVLPPNETLEVSIAKGEFENFLVPYNSVEAVDIVLKLAQIDGLVDIFVKRCQDDDLERCRFTQTELSSTLSGLDNIRFMKRVHKTYHMYIDDHFSQCHGSAQKLNCWMAVVIRARIMSNLNLSACVSPMEGERVGPNPEPLRTNGVARFRYEVQSLVTKSVMVALD
jgi:hypothetical protein